MSYSLFVGDVGEYLSVRAKQHDPSAVLIDRDNYHLYLNGESTGTGYVSLGDLPKIDNKQSVMHDLIDHANEVYLAEPMSWSDASDTFDHWESRRLIIYYLWEVNRRRGNLRSSLPLLHWKNTQYLDASPQRLTRDPMIWIAGCSISHGVGVVFEERYGYQVSQKLGIPAAFLTRSGTGIEWSANQIMRSDVRSGDIVIWGLTSEYRFARWNSDRHRLQHINTHNMQTSDLRTIGEGLEHRIYSAVASVHAVANFCEKIQVRLILLPLICTETLKLELHDCPYYHEPPYQHQWLDLGDDDLHPGPRQHQLWADFLMDTIHG